MRSSGSQPRPERVRPRQGACAGLLPCRPAPPRPFQSPRFLRNQAARSRCGALDIGARESLLAFLTGFGGHWDPSGSMVSGAEQDGQCQCAR